MSLRTAVLVAAGLLGTLGPSAQAAPPAGVSEAGVHYQSGGIGSSEQDQMRSGADRYSLWLTVASRRGAYLSDLALRVVDGRDRVVLQDTMAGPWLMADLPPGNYRVEATLQRPGRPALVQSAQVSITSHATRRVTLYFDTDDRSMGSNAG